VIHPQLEAGNSNMYNQSVDNFAANNSIEMRSAEPRQKLRIVQEDDAFEMASVSGARKRKADSFMERYQSDALLQAGSGMPNWSWNRYSLWNSPVTEGQTFELIFLSKTTYKILKLAGIALMLLWLYFLLKDAIKLAIDRFKHKSTVALLAAVFLMPVYTPTAEANSFPSQAMFKDLTARLLEAPDFAQVCASINSLQVSADSNALILKLTIHANSQSAVALPCSQFWQRQSFILNNKPLLGVYRQNSWLYVSVSKGISTLVITGRLIPVDNFQLRFKDKPKRIDIQSFGNWWHTS
jgi:hypothetical protein